MFEDERKRSSSSDPEDHERLLTDEEVFQRNPRKTAKTLSWPAIVVFITTIACVSGLAGFFIGSKTGRQEATEQACTKSLNHYCTNAYPSLPDFATDYLWSAPLG